MLPISTKEIIRFVPEECREQEHPPTYLLAVPTEWGKAELQRQMMATAGTRPADSHFTRALIEGIREVMLPDQQDDAVSAVERLTSMTVEPPPELVRRVGEIEDRVGALYPPYAALLAARKRHDDYHPVMAARLFLKGVENTDVTFTLTAGRVSDETLAALSPRHVIRAGLELMQMMYLPKEQEKNSESPSRSPSAPAISGEGESRRTPRSNGASSAKNTRKTPAS